MKLTGKALEEFETWFIPYVKENLHDYNKEEWNSDEELLKQFYSSITFSMQWGVYQDFFDSVNLRIDIKSIWLEDKSGVPIMCYEGSICGEVDSIWNSRSSAREYTIEKAVEIFNER